MRGLWGRLEATLMVVSACDPDPGGGSDYCDPVSADDERFDSVEQVECTETVRVQTSESYEEPWSDLRCGDKVCPDLIRVLNSENFEAEPDVYPAQEDLACALGVLRDGLGRFDISDVDREAVERRHQVDRQVAMVEVDGERRLFIVETDRRTNDQIVDEVFTRHQGALPVDSAALDQCTDAPDVETLTDCLFALTATVECAGPVDAMTCGECFE